MDASSTNENGNARAELRAQQAGQVEKQQTGATATAGDIVGEALAMPTDAERQRQERLGELRALRVSSGTEVEPETPALRVDGVGLFALGDIHALKGKQKCGKTTALKACLAAWMKGGLFRLTSGLGDEPRVLYLDTEQKQADVKLIVTDVVGLTGLEPAYVDEHLWVYALRRREYALLLDDLRLLVAEVGPRVVVIDGIVEFVASFNDEALAKQLIHDLLVLSEERRVALVCVLHTNKADDDHNMRGHLGTMLAQKAGTVLECRKERGSGVITVSCADARHEEMPSWSLMYAEQGRIVDADERRRQLTEERRADAQARRQEQHDKRRKERLDYALLTIRDHGGCIDRQQLTAILVSKFELRRNTVSEHISRWIAGGELCEVNGDIHASDNVALGF